MLKAWFLSPEKIDSFVRSNFSSVNLQKGKAWLHVDMDGLNAIYENLGTTYAGSRDHFYQSAVDGALGFFDCEKARATFFVIARDLDDPFKLAAVRRIISAGHHVACHGFHHRVLIRCSREQKIEETVSAKKKIEDVLGVSCLGFRAPGFSIDSESMELLAANSYRYDSSVFPNYTFRKRLGVNRLFPEPFLFYPALKFFEIPMPAQFPYLPPFHPCYSMYLTRWYFKLSLGLFKKNHSYLTMLFHLTDFSMRQKDVRGLQRNIMTVNVYSQASKLAFLSSLMRSVRRNYALTTTEDFIKEWPNSAPDLNPRVVLGISTTHETGACLVEDGRVMAAINEERLSRRKMDSTYPPKRSIREVLRISGISAARIDAVAIAGLHWQDLMPQTLDSFWQDVADRHGWSDAVLHFCRVLYRLFYFWRTTRYGRVVKFLRAEFGINPKIFYLEHHECHAACVYRTLADDGVLIVTADGVGDDVSLSVSEGSDGLIQRKLQSFYPHSFGQFYTACTQVLGFMGGRHEGKITGLSGFGRHRAELFQDLEKTIIPHPREFRLNKRYYSEGFVRGFRLSRLLKGELGFHVLEYRNYKMPLKKMLKRFSREDVAYAFQALLEREMLRILNPYCGVKPLHLALAGGVFANVKLNMALSDGLQPRTISIFPNMGDGGLCVGAALSVTCATRQDLHTVYLGPDVDEQDILQTLNQDPRLRWEKSENLTDAIALALSEGKIVARCSGKMEFGPRALGNRSILYMGRDPSVNRWLNDRLGRTEFMPFAPMCLYEDADKYFEMREGEKRATEFMTLVVRCKPRMLQECPAAVHVDHTARPQLIKRSVNPDMYDILAAYKQITGVSCVINTSFNMHEEPIVCTPQDAVRAFKSSRLDILVLGNYWVTQSSGASK